VAFAQLADGEQQGEQQAGHRRDGQEGGDEGAAEDPFQGDVVDQLRSLGRAVEAAQAEPGVL
jgi:hypothetical protein